MGYSHQRKRCDLLVVSTLGLEMRDVRNHHAFDARNFAGWCWHSCIACRYTECMARGGGDNPELHDLGQLAQITDSDLREQVLELLRTPKGVAARIVMDMLKSDPKAESFVVGGAIRDIFAGRMPKDVDVLVRGVEANELLMRVKALPGFAAWQGDSFTVLRYREPSGSECEIAVPRLEKSTGPGYEDFEFIGDHEMTVEEDLARRDYTVNAMAFDMQRGVLIDPFGGRHDMLAGRMHPISERSFTDDPLRMIRGCVLRARYGMEPSDNCRDQYAAHADKIQHLKRERIHDEIVEKLLVAPHAQLGVELAHQYRFWDYALPGLDVQPQQLDLLERVSDDPQTAALTRLAALLHANDPELVAEALDADNGKYSNEESDMVCMLIKAWPLPEHEDSSQWAAWLHQVGSRENAQLALDMHGQLHAEASLAARRAAIQQLLDRPVFLKEIALSGKDLIENGVEPGPDMGALLKKAQQLVWEDHSRNDTYRLLDLVLD